MPAFSDLSALFDRLTEPVLLLAGGALSYQNTAFSRCFPKQAALWPGRQALLLARAEDGGALALPEGVFTVSVTTLPEGQLFVLQPMQTAPTESLPFLPARLRRYLSDLSASIERMSALANTAAQQTLVDTQTQALFRLLRLTEQLELTQANFPQSYPHTTLDMRGLCRSLVADFSTYIENTSINFTAELPSAPLLLRGNTVLLQSLILSLLSNAVKANDLSGAMGLQLLPKDGRVLLRVWDSGHGLDPEELSRLFTPEGQDNVLPEPRVGTRLGLWLARRIALYHEGSLVAGNRPEGGAEFVLSLPLADGTKLTLRADPPATARQSDLSPILLELSDVLPARFFSHFWTN